MAASLAVEDVHADTAPTAVVSVVRPVRYAQGGAVICMLVLPSCHFPGTAWWKAGKRCRRRPSPSICRRCGYCVKAGRAGRAARISVRVIGAGEQPGDEGEFVVSGHASFGVLPG